LYYSQVLKQLIKPHQAHDIYLTKEQQPQEKVDWLVKDLKACNVMCEWWTSMDFEDTRASVLAHKLAADTRECTLETRVVEVADRERLLAKQQM
jgi:hypothetical protein